MITSRVEITLNGKAVALQVDTRTSLLDLLREQREWQHLPLRGLSAPGEPTQIVVTETSRPGDESKQFSMHAFGAVFAEVHVDVDLGLVRVARMLGTKGLGEITLVGVAPAIANAVFNATGKRIRELPITLEKLL